MAEVKLPRKPMLDMWASTIFTQIVREFEDNPSAGNYVKLKHAMLMYQYVKHAKEDDLVELLWDKPIKDWVAVIINTVEQ